MKILLAAGIFFPDIGGPAIHVRQIAERLAKEGFDVQVVAYGDDPSHTKFDFQVARVSRKWPKVLQWLFYLALVIRYSAFSRLIYAFDPTAAGVLARIGASIFNRPFLIRVGGDPIWEREAEMGRRLMPIDDYYKEGLYLKDKPCLYKVIRRLLRSADRVVVYNQNFKNFYVKYFGVSSGNIVIIKNPVFKRERGLLKLSHKPTILFAGRFVSYKNLPMVIQVLEHLTQAHLTLIGSGPDKKSLQLLADNLRLQHRVEFLDSLPQEKLFEHIKNSAICIGPALSEFNPNFILEALSFGKPVLLSKKHGLSVDLPEEFLFDPMNKQELGNKLSQLLKPDNYAKAVSVVNSLDLNQTWEDVTDAHLNMIKDIVRK